MRAMQFFKDLSLSAFVAGFVAVLVGFTSSVAIVFQAAQSFGATPAQITSWIWALGLGMGLCSLVPSLLLRKPVMVAWSTPGAAVLATAGAAGSFSMGEAVGAFMVCSLLVILVGATRGLERVADRIPMEIASALLAGVLARFGIQAFAAAQTALPLVLLMVGTYLVARRMAARYAVVVTLVVGILWVLITGQMAWSMEPVRLAMPVFVAPQWSVSAIVSLAIPLFVVTMASQNLPGMAVIRASGYELPVSRLITMTGWASLVLAPFGAFALNFSAITAAICMGPEAHEDRSKRYTAAASCGAIYILLRPHEVSSGGIFDAGILKVAHHPLG